MLPPLLGSETAKVEEEALTAEALSPALRLLSRDPAAANRSREPRP